MSDIVERLRGPCVDWDKADMPDGAEPLFMDCGTLRKAADEIEALRAEVESLKDPDVVHVNMLRGGIAKPSIAQIVHIYGAQAIARAALTQTKDTTNG